MAHKKDVSNAPAAPEQAPELVLLSGDQRRRLVDDMLSNRLAKLN